MTHKQAQSMDAIADATIGALKKSLAPRDAQISSLQQLVSELREKVAALEGRPPSVEYAGVYDAQKTYQPGQLVTRRGLWLARCATSTVPGADHVSWTLICKEKP